MYKVTQRMDDQPASTTLQAAGRTERGLFWWSLLAAVVLLVAMAGPFFVGKVPTRDDLGAFHLPIRAFYAEQLAVGEPFDWMPHLFAGFYLTGEGQAGTYHPLHWMLYRLLPLWWAWTLELWLSYPFLLAGTFLFLRRRIGRRDAAMFGSLVFTFSGFMLLRFVHPNAVAVAAHVPWMLWVIDVLMRESRVTRVAGAVGGVALLTGSQLLLGYPQYVWFSLFAEAGYVLFLVGTERRRFVGGRLLRLSMAKAAGLMLGGIQLLPTAVTLAHSVRRSADVDFVNTGSLHPLNLVQLVAPYLFTHRVVGQNTHELGLYAGAVPLVLAVWLLVGRPRLGRLDRAARAASMLGLVAMLLAFGKYGPVYRWQRLLPLVGGFRFPCRYMLLFHLAMAVLSAIAFAVLARRCRRVGHRRPRTRQEVTCSYPFSRRPQVGETDSQSLADLRSAAKRAVVQNREAISLRVSRETTAVCLALVVATLAAVVAPVLLDGRHVAAPIAVLAGPALIAVAAILVLLAARGVRTALVALVLFTAADLGFYGLSYAVYPGAVPLDEFVENTAAPPGHAGDRVLAEAACSARDGPRTSNDLVLAGFRRIDGYAGLEPARRLDYRRPEALRAAGVRWVRRTETTAAIEGLVPCDQDWLEVPDTLPRVRLVSRARQSEDPARGLAEVFVRSTAVVEQPLALPPGEPGKADVVDDSPGRLRIQVECSTPRLLVVSESYHRGWKARVDGRARRVWRTNGDFLGCPVRSGEREVVFEFKPESLRRGRIVSWLGLALVIVSVAGCLVRPGSCLG